MLLAVVGFLWADAVLIGRQVGYLSNWDFQTTIILAGSVMLLCTLGGAFGAKLLPPVVKQFAKKYRPGPV